ncbi:MAG: glycosyltransferase family 39 protein [Chloroflexota bacterium]|nr:glycosyltransferase family 39 protein [Chloroflexota bacterium]
MDRSGRALLVAMVGVLLAAFALRLEQLGVQSLWYDETVSAHLAAKSLGALVEHTARDIHPPLYYLLLHWWSGLMGLSEYALAFFSLWWGVLLVASAFTLARWLGGEKAALLTAALVTLSPFNVWYSQEVRMYTMGATLGLWTLIALWQLLHGARMKKRWMTLWVFSATAGLYTLYYFAFLLLWEVLFVAWWLWRAHAPEGRRRRWITLAGVVLLLWTPWMPIAVRQALNPPVPPWREGTSISTALLETLSALALGQSMTYQALQEALLLLALVAASGLWLYWRQRRQTDVLLLLSGALLLPFGVLILSSYSPAPLYHVRYIFTYSPAFYILLAIAFIAWTREAYSRARLPGSMVTALALIAPLLLLSAESVQRFWNDTAYSADDLRGGVEQVEEQWRTGDALLVNAGYAYTAFNHYFDDPISWQDRLTAWDEEEILDENGLTLLQGGSVGGSPSLGWGLAESDFYAMTPEQTIEALERVADDAVRLWHFRIYDTVTDPRGLIRGWLDKHALLFYDYLIAGDSNGRVQGWYFPPEPGEAPTSDISIRFLEPGGDTPWITLHGIDPPRGPQTGGSWVDFNLWLEGHEPMDPSVRLSLGLYDTSPAGRQWVPVLDEQPLGPLLSLKDVPGVQRWPVRLRLPQGIPPGKYYARLTFYRPSDGAVLPGAGERMPTPEQANIAVVEVGPTPRLEKAPTVGTRQEVRFGPLQLLGHAIPSGPSEPSASIAVELVWRALEESEENLHLFLTSDALSEDDGGVTKTREYPTSQWGEGEVVRDIHYVTVAPDVAPGEYPLYLRVSREAAAIPWTQGLFKSGEILQIGTITIEDRPRDFEPPTIAIPLDVAFGDSIQLVGATLPDPQMSYQAGGEVPVTLHWYATTRPLGRYKIFTHLISADGNLGPQRDLEPGDGKLPTNGWARGEYVTTAYTIPLPPHTPPGPYELRVGLYEHNTGERVQPYGANVNGEERYLVLGTVQVGSP